MLEKLVRAVLVGLVVAVATLIGLGWRAYGTMNAMGREIKREVKSEMLEIRNRDMEYVRDRFDMVEKLMVGKVMFRQPIPDPEPKK